KYKYFQLNKLDNKEPNQDSVNKIINLIESTIPNVDRVMIQDCRHGLLTNEIIKKTKETCKKHNKFLIVNSQASSSKANHQLYKGVDLICMNKKEAIDIHPDFDPNNQDKIIELSNILDSGVCITLGENGSIMYLNNTHHTQPGIKVKELDSCGAGDSFHACLTLADPKTNPNEALKLANIWAALSVKEIGTTVPNKEEFIKYVNEL
ncbi:hypothetical protein GOV12_07770, partial [Candidatus Pacearchaeota archaeon]|nr:hypothetical protein [Candidatus Pacearchaeota archaeon]